jgi:hypothetical protein
MRHLLLLASVAAILLVIDAFHFNGQYRTAFWQDVVNEGNAFTRDVEYRLRRALW